MDRQIAYAGQILPETTLLHMAKDSMVGLGMSLQAILGSSTLFDGLACSPTAPASLQVVVGPGSAYSFQNVDNSAFSSLGSDTTHQIVKQGIVLDPTTLNCPAPSTTGYSINYLVQAIYQDTDTGSTILPYYNAANPSVAYNGPANSGTSQNTIRAGQVVLSIKTGTAATTGSQATPSPDSGCTALYVVTVANGQTAITSGNISLASGAPFISEKLGDKISLATGDARYLRISAASSIFNGGTSTGTENAQSITTTQGTFTNTAGYCATFKAGAGLSNTGAMTLAYDGKTALPVKIRATTGLVDPSANAVVAGEEYMTICDGTNHQLISPASNPSAFLQAANNLSDVASLATTLQNLGFANTSSPVFQIPNPNNTSKPWIIQMGTTPGAASPETITYPTPFPNSVVHISGLCISNSSLYAYPMIQSGTVGLSSFQMGYGSGAHAPAYWIAIGN